MRDPAPDFSNTSWSPDEIALDRYLAGEEGQSLTGDGEQRLHQPSLQMLRLWLRGEAVSPTPWAREGSYARLLQQIEQSTAARARSPRRIGLSLVGRVSAVATLVIALFLSMVSPGPVYESAQLYRTAPGQRAIIRLAHDATITLAPATSVRWHANHITVNGEALFTVSGHPAHPWTIHTRNAIVHVLGTRFSVRQYGDESMSRVVVLDGRVALRLARSNTESATLVSQMIAVVTDSHVTIKSDITPREYMGWTQGRLLFNHTPLRDVTAELSRIYDTPIRIADSALAEKGVIAEIDVRQRSVTQVLDALAFILDAHYVRDGRAFVISHGVVDRAMPRGLEHHILSSQVEHRYGR